MTTPWDALGMEQGLSADLARMEGRIATLEARLLDLEGSLGSDRKLTQTRTVQGLTFTSTDLGSLGDVTALQANVIDATYGNQERDQITSLTTTVNELLTVLEAGNVITQV